MVDGVRRGRPMCLPVTFEAAPVGEVSTSHAGEAAPVGEVSTSHADIIDAIFPPETGVEWPMFI